MYRLGAMISLRRRVVNADPFLGFGLTLLHTSEKLLLKLVGQLKTYRVVVVGKLITNIASVGPGRLGA